MKNPGVSLRAKHRHDHLYLALCKLQFSRSYSLRACKKPGSDRSGYKGVQKQKWLPHGEEIMLRASPSPFSFHLSHGCGESCRKLRDNISQKRSIN